MPTTPRRVLSRCVLLSRRMHSYDLFLLSPSYGKGDIGVVKKLTTIVVSILWIFLSFGCSAMTHNAGNHMSQILTLELMNTKLETDKIDLSGHGECPGTLPLKVVNVENKTGQHIIYRNVGHKHYVLPTEFMDLVSTHFENKLVESSLTVDPQNGRPILVSMEKAYVDGSIVPEANLTIRIQIPDLDYAQSYSAVEGSASAYHALCYCVHLAIEKFMKDPVFQEFVQCR